MLNEILNKMKLNHNKIVEYINQIDYNRKKNFARDYYAYIMGIRIEPKFYEYEISYKESQRVKETIDEIWNSK